MERGFFLWASSGRVKLLVFFSLAVFFFSLVYIAFALPSISFEPPTLSDSSTTNYNWVFVNITSSEPLNQSRLEWANSSGYFNLSLLNSSPPSWYYNVTNLSDGYYNYTIWAQNTTGNWNRSGRRYVAVDTLPPNITAWSTNGTNASSPQDIMFLVGVNESVLFNVSVSDTSSLNYQWLVNKIDQNRNANNFTFTVPACDHDFEPSSCVWEVHLTVNDSAGNEAHKEWVVSNLTLEEAPYLFDSFTDGLYGNRSMSDPWGRPLPVWNKTVSSPMDASVERNYARTVDLQVHVIDTSDTVEFRVRSNVSKGTWFIRYRWWPNDAYTPDYNSWTGFDFLPIISTNNSAFAELWDVVDGHWWFLGGPSSVSRNFFSYPYVNMVGSQISSSSVTGTGWHSVAITRDDDGYFQTYLDGSAVRWSLDRSVDIPDSEYFVFRLVTRSPYPLEVDDVQAYAGRYVPPNPKIYFNSSQNAVLVSGHNVTLERIARFVTNESIFNYSSATRTATAYKDLKVMPGTNFHLKDSTLRMYSATNGERKLFFGNDVNFILDNSTLTSDTGYYFLFSRFGESYPNVAIQIVNSTLNNTGGIDTAVDSFYLENCNLTNLVGSDPLYVYFRTPTHKKLISNCRFSGKAGTERISLQGGMQFEEVYSLSPGLDIRNSVFENITLFPRYDWPYTYSNCRPLGVANLVNSRVPLKSFDGTVLRHKYYLDVFVRNGSGDPQQGAVVSVVNNQNNTHYFSENLKAGRSYLRTGDQYDYENCYANDNYLYFWAGPPTNKGQQDNYFPGVTRLNQNRIALTGADGHSPLPNDGLSTLVLTDSVEDGTSSLNFTYNITAQRLAYSGSRIATVNNSDYPGKTVNVVHPNGTVEYPNGALWAIGSASYVDPDPSWFRTDASIPNKTINITVQDTGAYFLNMSALPSSAPVSIIVDYFNFSAESGATILNFTANSTAGNEANFTVCNVAPSSYHSVIRDYVYFSTRLSNSSGCLNFTSILAGMQSFSLKETQQPNITILSPLNTTYGSGWVWVNVSIDENASWCGVSLGGGANQTLNQAAPRSWYLNLSVPSEGAQSALVSCNNTVGYMGDGTRFFSVNLSGCFPPNSGNWIVNRTIYCSGDVIMFPNLTVGSNGSVFFNSSLLYLGRLDVHRGGNFTLVNSPAEILLSGNISVYGYLQVNSSNILVSGHVLDFGNMSLNNLTLRMNATQTFSDVGYYNIRVDSSASFFADGVNVTRGVNYSVYWGRLIVYGRMLMNNSRVEYTSGGNAGGVYVNDPTSQTKVYNSVFYDDSGNVQLVVAGGNISFYNLVSGAYSSYALEVLGGIARVYDSSLLATTSVGAGRAYIVNSSMGNTWHATGGGEIWRQWYVDVNASDAYGNPVASANVSVYNVSGQLETANLTGSAGIARLIAAEYAQINYSGCGLNCKKAFFTPHAINVTKAGYFPNSTVLNLTQSMSTALFPVLLQQSQGPSGCSAINAAFYNASSNTIVLNNQTSTLCTVYYDISNQSLLSYDVGTNAYTLSASIDTIGGNLNLASLSLHINSTSDGFYVKSWLDLVMINVTVDSVSGTQYYVVADKQGYDVPFTYEIRNVFLDHGRLNIKEGGGSTVNVNPPPVIDNLTIQNARAVPLAIGAGVGGAGKNLTARNIRILDSFDVTDQYSAAIKIEGVPALIENVTLRNLNFSYGGGLPYNAMVTVIQNVVASNVSDSCIHGKEWLPTGGYVFYRDLSLDNCKVAGIHLYLSPGFGNGLLRAENVNISNSSYGVSDTGHNHAEIVKIFNLQIKDTSTAFFLAATNLSVTNFKATNVPNLLNYAILGGDADLRVYELSDVYVGDGNGIPLGGILISFVPNQTVGVPQVVDKWQDSKNYEYTTSDGHIPLPSNLSGMVALLRYRNVEGVVATYSYNVSAYDPSHIWTNVTHTIYPNGTIQQLQPLAQVSGVNPDSSWYRSNPNTYQNTTVLQINYTRTNITVNAGNNATNITVNKWNTSLPQGQILVNFTAESVGGNNVNFTLCSLVPAVNYTVKKEASLFASKTADSSGCIRFNNSAWTSHVFTLEEQGQGFSGCSAINAAFYNASSNTIVLNNQTSTLCTIYYDISNTSLLAYNASENSYVLSANVSISWNSTLVVNSTTLRFNEPFNNTYGITNSGTLNISNAVITSFTGNAWNLKNPNVAWYLNKNPSLWISNSDFSLCGAGIDPCIQVGAYDSPEAVPISLTWTNITIHDTLGFYALFLGYESYWVNISNSRFYNLTWRMIDLSRGIIRNSTFYNLNSGSGGLVIIAWGHGGSVYDSEFYNINIGTPVDGDVFYCKEASGGCVFENNRVHDFNMYSVLGVYGSQINNPVIFRNNVIENGNVSNDGVIYWRANQYLGGVNTTSRVYNNIIRNITVGRGFVFHSGGQNARIWNNTLYNVSGLSFTADYQAGQAGGSVYHPGDSAGSVLYDMELKDIRIYDLNDPANQSMRGSLLPLVNVKYTSLTVDMPDDYFYDYKYLDVKVVDTNSNPLNGTTVAITNAVNSSYPPIDLYRNNITSKATGADGHTKLPQGNETDTIAVLDFWKTSSAQQNMTYAISAFDPSHIWTNVTHTVYPNGSIQQLQPLAQVSGVNPDSSWYRSNPNTYQNTTVLQINYTRTNITVNAGLNATNITVTRWNTSLPQGQILVNFTAESVGGNNVNFTLCSLVPAVNYTVKKEASLFTSKAADSSGCIRFNNSAWTSHVFTLEEQGQGPSGCSAINAAFYNASSNTIVLKNQTSTLCTLYYDVNNQSALSYNLNMNTYILSANITGTTTYANLSLVNATLIINNAYYNQYEIKTWDTLLIDNMRIKPVNYSAPWRIWGYSDGWLTHPFVVNIDNSDFSGGQIKVAFIGWNQGNVRNISVKNSKFHNLTIYDKTSTYDYALNIQFEAERNTSFLNLTFEDINITGGSNPGPGVIKFGDGTGTIVDGVYFNNTHIYAVNSADEQITTNDGVIYFYGIALSPATISNFNINNYSERALGGKEYGQIKYIDGVITNGLRTGFGSTAFKLYRAYNCIADPTDCDKAKFWLWNVTINGASTGVATNGYDDFGLVDIYNSNISDVSTVYLLHTNPTPPGTVFYVTNTVISNYSTKYFFYSTEFAEVREFELADIKVIDKEDSPIENAEITFMANVSDQVNGTNIVHVVNRYMPPGVKYYQEGYGQGLQELNSTYTLANGHTPRPDENENYTVALLRHRQTKTNSTYYSYTLSAFDPSNIWTNVTNTIFPNGTIQQLQPLATVSGVNPDESWYRPNPNTYQNTTVLQINYARTNLSVNANQNATNITVTKWNLSQPQGQILVNFTAESVNGNNVNFTVCSLTPSTNYAIKNDGSAFTTKTANSQGCVWFNNSAWTSHVFTLEESVLVRNINTWANFSSIQAAIDDPSTLAGHTLEVGTGVFTENVNITKPLNLRSAGGFASTTINASNASLPAVKISANGVNLSGFTITGSNASGVYVAGYNYSKISGNVITNNWDGIVLERSNGNLLENNTIYGNLLFYDTESFEGGLGYWTNDTNGGAGVGASSVNLTNSRALDGSYSVNITINQVSMRSAWIERNYSLPNYSGDFVFRASFWIYTPPGSSTPRFVSTNFNTFYVSQNFSNPSTIVPIRYYAADGYEDYMWETISSADDEGWYEFSDYRVISNITKPWVALGFRPWQSGYSSALVDKVTVEAYGQSGSGVKLYASNSNRLANNLIKYNFGYGVLLNYSNYTSVHNNTVSSSGLTGIYSTANSNYNNISGNAVSKSGFHGISAGGSRTLIDNNTVEWNRGIGIEAGYVGSGTNATVINNFLGANAGALNPNVGGDYRYAGISLGTYSSASYNYLYKHPTAFGPAGYVNIDRNRAYRIQSSGVNFEYRQTYANVTNNVFTCAYSGAWGMRLKMAAYMLVANNTFQNCSNGIVSTIYHSVSSEHNLIENNTFRWGGAGIVFEPMESNVVLNNDFYGLSAAISLEGSSSDWPSFRYSTENSGYNSEYFLPGIWNQFLWTYNISGYGLLWSFDTGSGIKSTPAVSGYVSYLLSNGTLYALAENTGSLLWRFEADESTPSSIPGIGEAYFHSSPAVYGDKIFFGMNRSLYAVNKSGSLLWKFNTGGVVVSSPQPYNNSVYFGSVDGYLYALDLNGTQRWNVSVGPLLSTPAIISNITGNDRDGIVVSSWNGTVKAVYANGTEVWSRATEGGWPSPVNGWDYLFVGASVNATTGKAAVYALRKNNGTLAWNKTDIDGDVVATPAVSDAGFLYVPTTAGKLYLLSTSTGSVSAMRTVPSPIISSPAVTSAYLFFAERGGRLYREYYSVDTSSRWNYTLGGNVTSSLALGNGKIFVGSEDGKLYVFALPYNITIEGNRVSNTTTGITSYHLPLNILGNTFANVTKGIEFTQGGYVANSSVSGNLVDAVTAFSLANASRLLVLNTTFNRSRVSFADGFSTLSVGWYLSVRVVNLSGSPLAGASVSVSDSFGSGVFGGSADASGYVFTNLTEFVQNSTGVASYTPHVVVAAKSGYRTNSTSVLLDSSKVVTLVLLVETGPSPNITFWWNNVSKNQDLSVVLNETQGIFFNVSVDQIVDFSWFRNGSLGGSNLPNYTFASVQWGVWNVTVRVNNTNGTGSNTWILTVKDIPNINSVLESLDPVSVGSIISIEANITDLDGDLSGKFVVIDGVWYSMLPNGPDRYLANYTPLTEKVYYYYVYANDSTGLFANSSIYNFTAQQGPAISNVSVSPLVGNESTNFLVRVNVSDFNGVDKVFARFVQPSVFELELVNKSLGLYNATYNTSTPGFFVFFVRANDSLGSVSSSGYWNFSVLDTVPPNINSVSISPVLKNESTIITVSANVSDFNVSSVYADVSGPVNLSVVLNDLGEGAYSNAAGFIPHRPGFYSVRLVALDGSGNNNSFSTNYTVTDTQAPVLYWVSVAPSVGNMGMAFNISANVTDNGLVGVVRANVSRPDFGSDLLLLSGSNPYSGSYSGASLLGLYTLYVFANDSWGNSLYSFSFPFGTANFSIADFERPTMGWLNVSPAVVNSSQKVSISANVTDDNRVNFVFANVTRPDSFVLSVVGFVNSSSVFSANFSNTTVPGVYSVNFVAVDVAGNWSSAVSNFSVVDTISPQIGQFLVSDGTPSVGQAVTFTSVSSDNDVVGRVSGLVNVTRPDNLSVLLPLSEVGYSLQGSPPSSVVVQSGANFTPILPGNYSAMLFVGDRQNNSVNLSLGFEAFDRSAPVLDSISVGAVEGWNVSVNFSLSEAGNYTFVFDAGAGWVFVPNSSFGLNHSVTLPKFAANTNVLYYLVFSDVSGNGGRYPAVGVTNFSVGALIEFNQSVMELNLTEKQAYVVQVGLRNPSSVPVNVSFNRSLSWVGVPSGLYLTPLQSATINISLVPDDSGVGDWQVNGTVWAHGSASASLLLVMSVFHVVGDGECDLDESCGSVDCGVCSSSSSGGPGGGSSGGVAVPSMSKSVSVAPGEPLVRIVVNLRGEVSDPGLVVRKLGSIPVSPPVGLVYHYFNVSKVNFNDSDVQNATVEFRVNRSWLVANGVERVFLARFDGGWGRVRTELVNSTLAFNSYWSYPSAFSYFAIVGERTQVRVEVPQDNEIHAFNQTMPAPVLVLQEDIDAVSSLVDSVKPQTGKARDILERARLRVGEAQRVFDAGAQERARDLLEEARRLAGEAAGLRAVSVAKEKIAILTIILALIALTLAAVAYYSRFQNR